ncbi:MAG: TIM barrel protein [Mycobacteriales bacterium]
MFGQMVDRYATNAYGPAVGTLEAIKRAASVGSLETLDINYPWPERDLKPGDIATALSDHGLRAEAVTPVIYDRQFRSGSFTNADPQLRRAAIDLGKQAVDVAHALGARYVKFWPGQDGFDFPFQVDYRTLWGYAVDGVREVAESAPDMQFAIEYKKKEPRTHIFFATAAETLLAIEDMGVSNVGIVVDLGHSLFAKEVPAQVVHTVAARGKLVSLEVNDNWREWDDDLPVGSLHLIETLEFLEAARAIDWQQTMLLDQFPFREDPASAARSSIQMLNALEGVLDRLDAGALQAARASQDGLVAQRVVNEALIAGWSAANR